MYILISAIKKKENWPALCKKYSFQRDNIWEREKTQAFVQI